MSGNVAEWVADWMDGNYYRTYPTDDDPKGPSGGETDDQRAYRGGSFEEVPGTETLLHVATRACAPPDTRRPTLGFRCVRSVQ